MTDPAPADDPRIEGLLAHQRWVRALASRLVRGHDADDLVQEAWLATLTDLPDDDRPKRPWLAGVLRNLARMRARGERRRSEREARSRPWQSPPATPAELASRLDTQRQLADLVAELPEPLRTTVLLRYFEDLSAAEIARIQGIPAATVRTRLKRGLAALRGQLDARHAGERGAWCAALLALETTPGQSTPPAVSGSVPTLLGGAIAMGLATKIGVSVVAVGALAAAVWMIGTTDGRSRPTEPTPDLTSAAAVIADRPSERGPRRAVREPVTRATQPAHHAVDPSATKSDGARRLTVRVRDAAGAGIARAQVLLLSTDRVVAEQTTNAGGDAALAVPVDALRLLVAPDGAPPSVHELREEDTERTIVIAAGEEVRGLVRVNGAQPGEPIRVWLVPPLPPLQQGEFSELLQGALRARNLWPRRIGVTADAEGRFAFRGLPDSGTGSFLPPDGYAIAPGQGSSDGTSSTVRIPDAAATLHLEHRPSIQGRVVDALGLPVAGARILVAYVRQVGNSSIALREPTEADDEGRFEALLPMRGHTQLTVTATRPDGGGIRRVDLPEDLAPRMDLGDVALPAVRTVRMRVVDARGEPIPGAVALLDDGRWDFRPPTGEDGRVQLQLSADGGTVMVGAPGYEEARVELDGRADTEHAVTLRHAARIDVTVLAADGVSPSRLFVELATQPDPFLSRAGGVPDTHAQGGGVVVRIVSMSTEGHWHLFQLTDARRQTIWGLRPGQTVALAVQDRLGNVYATREVELPDATPVAITLEVDATPRSITGRVLDAEGRPAAGAFVWMHSPDAVSDLAKSADPGASATHCGDDGRFRFDGVFAPRVLVVAKRPGQAPSQVVELSARPNAVPTALRLQRGRSVRVRVRDAEGAPVDPAIVDALVAGYEPWTDPGLTGSLWRAAPEGGGSYLLTDLPAGECEVRVLSEGWTRTATVAADDDEVEVVFPVRGE